jgi:CheY-like chemotaxis protein/two-component sensor histidine kinase
MDVSRITRDKIELHKERIALDKVIRQAIETSRPLIESHGNILTTDMRRQQITVDGDAIRLTQVFCNLLNNAAKYSEPGGHIDLELVREGDEAVARVRDHGRGIPPEMLTKVFDLFVQVDQPLERSGGGGLGIGLSLVRRLIEMHGGAVEAHSDGPGTGSEFIVRLPISPSEMPVTPKPQSIDVSASPARRRVLIVDDNEDASESLALVLRLMGHEIATASDGLAALNIAKSFLPELILLDIGMPALNGYETAARIREQPWSRGVRLVALTGWGQDADRKRSAEAGFDLHLVKPIDPAEIERLLADLPLA